VLGRASTLPIVTAVANTLPNNALLFIAAS
jgi:hypothetical protein